MAVFRRCFVLIFLIPFVLLTALVISGCGGGGGDDTTVSQTNTVSGIVRNAENGGLISGATVTISPDSAGAASRTPMTTTTDFYGRYACTDTSAGAAHVHVEAPGFTPVEFDVTVPQWGSLSLSPSLLPQSNTSPVNVRILPQAATVAVGDVIDFTANISIWNALPFYTTDGDIGIISSTGKFVATKSGRGTVSVRLGAAVNTAAVTVVESPSAGAVAGITMDPNGIPVPRTRIKWGETQEAHTVSDQDGIYYIRNQNPGGYLMSIQAIGYSDSSIPFSIDAGKTKMMNIILEPSNLVGLTISPSSVELGPGEPQTFSVSAFGNPNPSVIWSVLEGDSGGTISYYGTYIAPPTRGTYHIVATNISDPSQKATATVTVRSGGGSVIVE